MDSLEDEVDDLLGRPVGDAEVDPGDQDEAQDHRGGLADLAAIRPLDTLELRPRGAEEVDEPVAARGGGAARGLGHLGAAATVGGRGREGLLLQLGLLELPADAVVDRVALGAADDAGLEDLLVARDVLEQPRDVVPVGLGRLRTGVVLLACPLLAVTRALSLTGQLAKLPRLAGLLVARMPPAPLAVLAHADAVRV